MNISGNVYNIAVNNATHELSGDQVLFSTGHTLEIMEEATFWFDADGIGERQKLFKAPVTYGSYPLIMSIVKERRR